MTDIKQIEAAINEGMADTKELADKLADITADKAAGVFQQFLVTAESMLKHFEDNLHTFEAHEKALLSQWLLDAKNRVRTLLSRIV